MSGKRLIFCESECHERHVFMARHAWKCAHCGRILCPQDGVDDDAFEICDFCWGVADLRRAYGGRRRGGVSRALPLP